MQKKSSKIILIVIISVVIIGGVLTWGFLTNWWQGTDPSKNNDGTASENKLTFLTKNEIKKGSLNVPVDTNLEIGQKIIFGKILKNIKRSGVTNNEYTVINDSNEVNKKIMQDYPVGTQVTVVSKKPVNKINKCAQYDENENLKVIKCKKCKKNYFLEDDECNKYTYKGSQENCNKRGGIFIPGGDTTDQICNLYECEDTEYVDKTNNKCTKYSLTEQNCHQQRKLFTPGSKTADSKCGRKCDEDTEYVHPVNKQCTKYSLTEQNCHQQRKLFITGSETADSKCGKNCGNTEYIKDNACVGYSYTGTQFKCNKLGKIFTTGGITNDQTCEKTGNLNTHYVNENEYVIRPNQTAPSCDSWIYYQPMKPAIICKEFSIITNIELLKELIRKKHYDGEYIYQNTIYHFGPIKDWKFGSISLSGLFKEFPDFNENISGWNVSNVTDMSRMFQNATKFNGNISGWNVTNVKNMSRMFEGAILFNQNLNSWNVTKVENMSLIFSSAYSFNGDISGWNVTNVKNMSYMFERAFKFNRDLSAWDVSNVENMEGMFYDNTNMRAKKRWYESSLTPKRETDLLNNIPDGILEVTHKKITRNSFNGDISTWDTSSVTNMSNMFAYSSFNNNNSINTKQVTVGENTYLAWDVSNVKNMSCMFVMNTGAYTVVRGVYRIHSFQGDISKWDTSNVKNMEYMFSNAWFRNSGDINTKVVTLDDDTTYTAWDVRNVENMKKMFSNAREFNKDISKWNVSKVLDMYAMFNYAQDFKQNINTQQVTVGENTYLAWDVSNVPLDKSRYMFYKVTAIPRWYSTEKRMIKRASDGKWYDFVQDPIVEYDIIPNFKTLRGLIYDYHKLTLMKKIIEFLKGKTECLAEWGRFPAWRNFGNCIATTTAQRESDANKIFQGKYPAAFRNKDSLDAAKESIDSSSGTSTKQKILNKITTNESKYGPISRWKFSPTITSFYGNINLPESNYGNYQHGLFYETYFNEDISNWDVRQITNMSSTFAFSDFNRDLTGWDVSNVTNMTAMFRHSKFNADISNWNVSNVTNMTAMFQYSQFAGDISKWDIENANRSSMFSNSPSFLKDEDVKNCQLKNQYLPDNNCTQ